MVNKTMSISAISKSSKQFKDTHTLKVGGFKVGGGTRKPRNTKPPKWFSDFVNNDFKKVLDRLENLEKFNNFVVDQFNKHGWIK